MGWVQGQGSCKQLSSCFNQRYVKTDKEMNKESEKGYIQTEGKLDFYHITFFPERPSALLITSNQNDLRIQT